MTQKPDFLTDYEFDVFQHTIKGKKPDEIAETLNSDKKYKNQKKTLGSIRKTKVVVRKKIEKRLVGIAKSLRLDHDLTSMPKDSGLLVSYDWTNDTKVYIIFTIEEGILAWYEHECSDKCKLSCKEILDLVIRERNIPFTENQEALPILEQFRFVISKIQEKGWFPLHENGEKK